MMKAPSDPASGSHAWRGYLRVLLALIVGFVVLIGPFVWNVYHANTTTAPITRVGGYVEYTADGAGIIGGVGGARSVEFVGSNLTDDDLGTIRTSLAALPKVYCISFLGTQISDEGLDHLSGLTQVQQIDLRETQVTRSGAVRLQAMLPNCHITTDFPQKSAGRDERRINYRRVLSAIWLFRTWPKSMKTGRDHFLFWLVSVIPFLFVAAVSILGMIRNLLR